MCNGLWLFKNFVKHPDNLVNIYLDEFSADVASYQINNNLRCYDLAMELSNSTIEALPQNYAEQVMS